MYGSKFHAFAAAEKSSRLLTTNNDKHNTYYTTQQLYDMWMQKTGHYPNIGAFNDTVSCETNKQYVDAYQQLHPADTLGATHCQSQFALYYNTQRGTNFTFAQIDSLNYGTCGAHISVCPLVTDDINGPLLCGHGSGDDAGLMIPPVDPDSVFISNCSDSAALIYSNATEIYRAYRDSVLGDFEHSYRLKCLDAYKLETFTVTHPQSEFHYTLYYYDQSGNLVKTISPKGAKPNWDPVWAVQVRAARANGTLLLPAHEEPTQYRYNTLGKVSTQQSPDGGPSAFWYDRLGRLVISQNAQQHAAATQSDRLYSYTNYDALGRITEVGQIKNSNATTINDVLVRNPSSLNSWMTANASYAGQITHTIYDQPYGLFQSTDDRLVVQQRNLRNRVSYTTLSDTAVGTAFNQATFYSYDIHGNVDTLLQDYGVPGVYPNIMNQNGNRYKKISYQYDLISGKVNEVAYQRGWSDQFFHRYSYDAENRLTVVETSADEKHWEKDARYEYYRHGPLARMVLGEQQVQGIDYAYTLQGWLSGMNSSMGDRLNDMGEDGLAGAIHQYVGRDVIGLRLNYYTGDFVPINSAVGPFPASMGYLSPGEYRPLYNGNISSMVVNNRGLQGSGTTGGPLMLYNYRYDQLNRLLGATANNTTIDGSNSWAGLNPLDYFKESLRYDANGNILGYARNGHKSDVMMDSLTYHYVAGSNRLDFVSDSIAASRYGGAGEIQDIDNQNASNYGYDAIGNLVRDDAEGITNIRWNVYGKIAEIDKTASANQPVTKINYSYDAQGNRVGSITEQNDGTKKYTWYVRDAQGNVMTVYNTQGTSSDLSTLGLQATERHIYGSNAMGMDNTIVNVSNGAASITDSNSIKYWRGTRQYSLSNHLGNVLAAVGDRKIGHDTNSDGVIDYYDADIRTAQDYYAFGMTMPGRNYTAQDANAYRYGFNGKENDNEVKGLGNQQDYGMRIYDPRLGRFLSEDPLTAKFSELTPYQFASNRPIDGIDLDGLEWATGSKIVYQAGSGQSYIKTTNYVKLKVINESKLITDPNVIKAKAEIVARGIERSMATPIQIPLRKPAEIIETKVILDFSPSTANDGSIGKLTFDDRSSKSTSTNVTVNGTTTTTTLTASTPGETKGAFMDFNIKMGITMDGKPISNDELQNTGSHEAFHSAGGNHPWSLSTKEKELASNINQNDPITRNAAAIKSNLMNSAENPDPNFGNNSGNTLTSGQLKAISQRIKQHSAYAPEDIQ